MIGKNIFLGFFEAIITDEGLKKMEDAFYDCYSDPEFYQRVNIDKQEQVVHYYVVDPISKKVENEVKQKSKFSDFINEWIATMGKKKLTEIDKYVEDHNSDEVVHFLKSQLLKIKLIENRLPDSEVLNISPTIDMTISDIKLRLTEYQDIYGDAETTIRLDNSESTTSRKSIKDNLTKDDIYGKYLEERREEGITTEVAFKDVRKWLIDDLGFTKEEIKNKYNITLEYDAFKRSANNQHHLR